MKYKLLDMTKELKAVDVLVDGTDEYFLCPYDKSKVIIKYCDSLDGSSKIPNVPQKCEHCKSLFGIDKIIP